MSFRILLRKECMEMARNYRLLFVPLILVFLALANIILMKMMPDIIASGAGNLPPGTVIQIPPPSALDAAQKMIAQFDQLGVLVLILLFMGAIAGERASGVMTTILIKPVSRLSYVGAKVLSALLLTTISYVAAIAVSYLYVSQLFDQQLELSAFITGSLLYLPKFLLIVVIAVFFSSFSKSPVVAGGLTLVVSIAMSFASNINGLKDWFPTALTRMSVESYKGQSVDAAAPVFVTLVFIALLLTATCWIVSRKEK